MSNKFMKHTPYSDWVILNHADRAIKGNYPSLTKAFKQAAKVLKCRETQIASKYYSLKHQNITVKDVKNWTEQDMLDYNSGDPDKIVRSYPKGRSGSTHDEHFKGVGEDDPDKIEFTTLKGDDMKTPVTETKAIVSEQTDAPDPDTGDEYKRGYATAVEQAIKSLLIRTSKEVKISIVKHIMKDL